MRNLWEEDVPFDYSTVEDEEEEKSIKSYCENSGYKYFSHFISGLYYKFDDTVINEDNSVSLNILINT